MYNTFSDLHRSNACNVSAESLIAAVTLAGEIIDCLKAKLIKLEDELKISNKYENLIMNCYAAAPVPDGAYLSGGPDGNYKLSNIWQDELAVRIIALTS